MRYFTLFLLSFLFSNLSYSQSYLRATDPNDWLADETDVFPEWHQEMAEAKLDEVTLVLHPKGIYTEVELFATISQGDAFSWWSGEMEIIWQFNLPQQAIVHDSWLWVGEDIIQADVVDFWTASEIYEEIVDRNQDPSLLYILPNGTYEIRIYPLFEGDSRRIKMSFLLPNNWSDDQITTEVLLPMLQSTSLLPDEIEIIIPHSDQVQNPELETKGNENLVYAFETQTTPNYGSIYYKVFPGNLISELTDFNLNIDAPWNENKTYFQTYEENGESFYQLAYKPDWDEIFNSSINKTIILLDIDSTKTVISNSDFIEGLNSQLSNINTSQDSFAIMVSTDTGIQMINENWVSFDSLEASLNMSAALLQSSNLESILTNGLTFIANETDASVFLASTNDNYASPVDADAFLAEVNPYILDNTPINIVDIAQISIQAIMHDNILYIGNEYLFDSLAELTNGNSDEVRETDNEDYSNILEAILYDSSASENIFGIVDLNVDFQNGLAYLEQDLFSSFYNNTEKVFYQTGKYIGDFPVELDASLVFENGDFIHEQVNIQEADIIQGDTLMREIWYGNYLKAETLTIENSEERDNIIQQSIDERVLIPLTAFLALEPSMGGTVCIPCLNNPGGGIIIDTTDEEKKDDSRKIVISPNPAIDFTSISLTGIQKEEIKSIEIIDSKGTIIEILTEINLLNDNTLNISWQIDQSIKAGIYFCKIRLEDDLVTEKIIVIK